MSDKQAFVLNIDDAVRLRALIDTTNGVNLVLVAAAFLVPVWWVAGPVVLLCGLTVHAAMSAGGTTAGSLGGVFMLLVWLAVIIVLVAWDAYLHNSIRDPEAFQQASLYFGFYLAATAVVVNGMFLFRGSRYGEANPLAAPLDRRRGCLSALLWPLAPLRGYRRPAGAGALAVLLWFVASILRLASMALLAPAVALRRMYVVVLAAALLTTFLGDPRPGHTPFPVKVLVFASVAATLTCVRVVLPLLSAGFSYGAQVVHRSGGFLVRQSFAHLVEKDRRPPVLFLRSFADDQVSIHQPKVSLLKPSLRQSMRLGTRRLDHMLVERFSLYGPIVAIGRPGEKQLPFGAARLYVENRNWRRTVIEIAEKAQAIVVVVETKAKGASGLAWETKTTLARFADKTVFLSSPTSGPLDENALIRDYFADATGDDLPSHTRAVFTKDDTCVALVAREEEALSYEVSLQAFFRRELFSWR